MLRASERAVRSACRFSGGVGRACAAGLLLAVTAAGWASEPDKGNAPPQPWVTMSLRSLGVPAIPQSFLQVGSSMLTLHMVDDTHLLLTFSSRGLVPRDKDDKPDEESRMVGAELVELPTGKILARADWKMHDHGRYLWRMGKGRFLLRSRHSLFVLEPLALLNTPDPLRPLRFPTREGKAVAAFVSPEKSMLMVETMPEQRKGVMTTSGTMVVNDPESTVWIDFYRLSGGDAPGVPLTVKPAGMVRAPAPVKLPMDGDGYLWSDRGQHGRWPVSFNEFGGREVKIAAIDSACEPRFEMVSRFEFLAFTCSRTDSRAKVKSYGMDGHETWEDSLGGTFGMPELAFAPEAGRFALSRIMSGTDITFGAAIPEGATQEVRVYQTESGQLLLKVPTTPVTRFAENFDLSEDGSVVAVVTNGAVEVYKLPPPSAQDVKDLEEAKSFSPPLASGPVQFAKLESRDGGEPAQTESAAAENQPAVGSAVEVALPVEQGGGGVATASVPEKPAATDAGVDGIDDAAALAVMSRRVVGGGGGAAKAAGPAAGSSAGTPAAEPGSTGSPAGGDEAADGAGDGVTRRHGPPTLLEPGESVEKGKPTAQQPSSNN